MLGSGRSFLTICNSDGTSVTDGSASMILTTTAVTCLSSHHHHIQSQSCCHVRPWKPTAEIRHAADRAHGEQLSSASTTGSHTQRTIIFGCRRSCACPIQGWMPTGAGGGGGRTADTERKKAPLLRSPPPSRPMTPSSSTVSGQGGAPGPCRSPPFDRDSFFADAYLPSPTPPLSLSTPVALALAFMQLRPRHGEQKEKRLGLASVQILPRPERSSGTCECTC